MMTKKKVATGTDWARLKRQGQGKEPIDFSDIPELDASFWEDAALVVPDAKTKVTIRIDTDVYRWFTSQGSGYQTRMNAVLRSYMMQRALQSGSGSSASERVSGSVHEPRRKYSTGAHENLLVSHLAQLLTFCQQHPEPAALTDALKQYDKRHSKRK